MQSVSDCIYQARSLCCKKPYGAVAAGERLILSTYPARSRGVGRVVLCLAADGQQEQRITMRWSGLCGNRDHYEAALTAPAPGLYWYYFIIETSDGPYYVCRGYAGRGEILERLSERFQLTVYDPSYVPPSWFGEGITYQIFPDRFARHQMPAQPEGEGIGPRVLHQNWDDTPVYLPDAHGEILNNDFFGGTLRGVMDKLDYLASLSVRTIYFNPIFQAFSNHRYDTGDYKKIDPMLGNEQDFAQLCVQAAKRGMRVILDGVFNHTGFDSRYFNGRGRYTSVGAYQSKQSPYYDWYDFAQWPDRYGSWWGVYTLPQVNEMNQSYLRYIVDDPDSVVRRWLRLGASGWRLDVADELPDAFIARLNAAAKEEKPDALVIGEVWEDASNKIAYSERRRYLQGGELDSVMNYPLRDAILAFLNGGTAEHFAEQIECIRENYPRAVFYNLMNIVGTHDTARMLTMLGVSPDEVPRDKTERAKYRLSFEQLACAKRRLKLAAVLQYTMPGSPTLYYGDEAGMQGFDDPLNRGTYPWGKENKELVAFYQQLGQLRTQNKVLQSGELRFVPTGGGLLYYERYDEDTRLAVLVNRTHHAIGVPLHASEGLELFSGVEFAADQDEALEIDVPPETAMIVRLCGQTERG